MSTFARAGIALAMVVGLLGLTPDSADALECVVGVHGTGDQSASSAPGYWDGTLHDFANGRPVKIVDYQGTSYKSFDERAWGRIVKQTSDFLSARGCDSFVYVTHSNGNNPIRYIMMHPTLVTSSTNGSVPVQSVLSKLRKAIWLAADARGTQLADKVTTSGTLANIANSVVAFLGLMNYNTPAVWMQRRDNMAVYNSNGTFSNSAGACGARSTCNGFATQNTVGTKVHAAIWSGDAHCGGYLKTVGLKISGLYAFGSGACHDGFLPCDSQEYNGQNVMRSDRLNHNQSRRDCKGLGSLVATAIDLTWAPAYYPPPDTQMNPAAQACNVTINLESTTTYCASKLFGICLDRDPRYAHTTSEWLACPDSWRNDGYQDVSCYAAYEEDDGKMVPRDYYYTPYNNYNYGDCSDSRRGDGYCDLCLVAKYGYDGMPGSNDGEDDCVYASQTGTIDGTWYYGNRCRDLFYDYADRHFQFFSYFTGHERI